MTAVTKVRLSWGEGRDDHVEAQVNPTELSFDKGVSFAEVPIPGLDSPVLQFVRGNVETVSLELFFDTTETGRPVTTLTDAVYRLVKIDPQTHAPPVCTLTWGPGFPGSSLPNAPRTATAPGAPPQEAEPTGGSGESAGPAEQGAQQVVGFRCVVERIQQRFTLFDAVGTPLRAILTVSLKEYKTVEEQIEELNLQSNDRTRQHLVLEGETLPQIAAHRLGSASRWRALADHNGLHDPRALRPGTVLEIPPLP